jgi:hypothetical protein
MGRRHFSYIYIALLPFLIILLNNTASADSAIYTITADSNGNGNEPVGYDHHNPFYGQSDGDRFDNDVKGTAEIQAAEKEETAGNVTIQDWSTPAGSSEISANTVFDIFYGTNQTFGKPGLAQKWVNILGNVSDPDGIASLSYTLNGGASQYLAIGPDTRRLAAAGDFNVEIDPLDLKSDSNTVVISAKDELNETASVTVTVNYDPTTTWPLPYSINWDTVSSLQDVVQIVDGEWTITSAGVRTDAMEYDRVLAVGDITWTDYEIKVPITIHDSQPTTRDGAGIGIAFRWTGHTNSPVNCGQPHCGWLPNGPRSWYPMESDGPLNMGPFNKNQVPDYSIDMNIGDTYTWKMRVQTVDSNTSNYYLKVWESSQSEPASWNITQEVSDYEPLGAPILIAHNVDATFGDITVNPVGSDPPIYYRLNIDIEGNGSVTTSPDRTLFSDGETVTLTAVPDSGWKLSGWSDDATGSSYSIPVKMDSNKTVTATFIEGEPETYTLTTNLTGNGGVERVPDQDSYLTGSTVTLTAVPDAGWLFDSWGGDLTGNDNPTTITMNDDKAVTAIFTQINYALTVTADDHGSVTKSPNPNQEGVYPSWTEVTLTAVPNAGWQFESWGGDLTGSTNPGTITMDGDKTVMANFTEVTYTLTVGTVGSGGVIKSPTQVSYLEGTEVTLTAVPSAGWQFSSWSGDLTGNTNPATITMDSNKTVTATFTDLSAPTYTLNVSTAGSGSVVKSPDQATYPEGTVVTLTAVPNTGWFFNGWYDDLSGQQNPVQIIMDKDYLISADFRREGMDSSFYLPVVIKP